MLGKTLFVPTVAPCAASFTSCSLLSLVISSFPLKLPPLPLVLSSSHASFHIPLTTFLFLKPRLSDALHLYLPLYSILSSSTFLLSSLLPEPASPRVVQSGVKTVMLSLLGWHNSTSLWGVKALTPPCLSVCAAPLSAPVNPSWLIGWYLSCCLPVCPTSSRGEWSSDGCV